MTHRLTLKDQINANPPEVSLVLSWREGIPMRTSDLIRERVLLEWDRCCDRAERDEAEPAARPLVELGRDARRPDAARDRAGGAKAPMSRDDAVALALHGFAHNAFIVIVDDRQVTDLDAEIRLVPGTDITFIRILPLVGG